MAARLGAVCRDAREAAGVHALTIAQSAQVSQPTLTRFELGYGGWRNKTDRIVEAYERECGLADGELWRRAAGC